MSTTPAPAPRKQSNVLWWILGLLLAAVVMVGLGGLLLAGYFLREMQVRETSGHVEISTPAGSLKVGKDAGADPGLPVYPGAGLAEPGAAVELSSPHDEVVSVTAARYRTPDPLDRVDAWYRDALGPEFAREGPGMMIRKKNVFGISVKSSDIVFLSETDELLRVVVLERKGSATEIGLARIGKQESQ